MDQQLIKFIRTHTHTRDLDQLYSYVPVTHTLSYQHCILVSFRVHVGTQFMVNAWDNGCVMSNTTYALPRPLTGKQTWT